MRTKNYIKAGMQFGHLTVIGRVLNHTKDYHSMWLCQCDCGVRHHLGTFETLEKAVKARKIAEDELIPKK